jgi:hypothetical protein
MQINTKPQSDDDDKAVAEKRKKNKYTKNTQKCMSNTERKKYKSRMLVIFCISKNNNINKAEEEDSYINIISQLFSLSHSSIARNAETTTRCPHCRPLTIFFSTTLLCIR